MTKEKEWHDIEAAREILLHRITVTSHFKELRSDALFRKVSELSAQDLIRWIDTELTPAGRNLLMSSLRTRRSRLRNTPQ